jgi:hypothetical protein
MESIPKLLFVLMMKSASELAETISVHFCSRDVDDHRRELKIEAVGLQIASWIKGFVFLAAKQDHHVNGGCMLSFIIPN